MASLNKVMLIGNLGRDPEVRYTPNGDAVANISIATTSNWKDKATGEKKEATEWHRVVFYGKLAEIVGEYAKKGRPLYVEGRLQTRKWTNKEGADQYTTEVIADQMQLLGSREGAGESDARMDGGYSRDSAQSYGGASSAGGAGRSGGAPARKSSPTPEMDDDIPF